MWEERSGRDECSGRGVPHTAHTASSRDVRAGETLKLRIRCRRLKSLSHPPPPGSTPSAWAETSPPSPHASSHAPSPHAPAGMASPRHLQLNSLVHLHDVSQCPVALAQVRADALKLSAEGVPNYFLGRAALEGHGAATQLQRAVSWIHRACVSRRLTREVAGVEVWAQVRLPGHGGG